MPRAKTVANTLIIRPIAERPTSSGETKSIMRTVTIPARYIEEWARDKTYAGGRLAIIPFGGLTAPLGFLALPADSPIKAIPKNLESAFRFFESELARIYDENVTELVDTIERNRDNPKILGEGLASVQQYSKRIDLNKKYEKKIDAYELLVDDVSIAPPREKRELPKNFRRWQPKDSAKKKPRTSPKH
jgi:hypothetical protein